MAHYSISTDGGSRNNPGPAAIGYVIQDEQGKVLKEVGEYIGERTNNEAEYLAPITALKKLKSLAGKEKVKKAEVLVRSDSELVVKQMRHEYKVVNEKIQPLFLELWNLLLDFGTVSFEAVPREQNKEADRLVNEALDERQSHRELI